MNGFIEVTSEQDNLSMLIAISTIRAVVRDKRICSESVYIETGFSDKHGSSGVFVTDAYDVVKAKIIKAG